MIRLSPTNNKRPSPTVGRSIGQLATDAIRLLELQASLVKVEARTGFNSLLVPLFMLVAAFVVGLGSAPVAIMVLAELLVEWAALSRTLAYAIAAAASLGTAIGVGFLGWIRLRSRQSMFQGSASELKKNLTWIRQVFNERPSPADSNENCF